MNIFFKVLLLMHSLLYLNKSLGAIDQPLTDLSELVFPMAEVMLQIQGATVILADYPLLRKDFIFLQGKIII